MVWMVRYMLILVVNTGSEKDDIDEKDDNESSCLFVGVFSMIFINVDVILEGDDTCHLIIRGNDYDQDIIKGDDTYHLILKGW